MKALLKEIYSLGLNCTLEEYWPDNFTNFGISIRLMIGSENSSAAESFDIFVCTPDWIKSQYEEEKVVWGRHMLIVLEYDLDAITAKINHCIESCTGEDWPTIAQKIARFAAWEFEEYQS